MAKPTVAQQLAVMTLRAELAEQQLEAARTSKRHEGMAYRKIIAELRASHSAPKSTLDMGALSREYCAAHGCASVAADALRAWAATR